MDDIPTQILEFRSLELNLERSLEGNLECGLDQK